MKLVPLGVNGYLPINGRHTSCFLALYEDVAFMLDAGTGAARLHEPHIKEMLAPYQDIHLLLSHYHVDHTVGLYYAFTALRGRTFHVHAPTCPFMPANPEEAIKRYFSPPLNSFALFDASIHIEPLNQTEHQIGGHRIEVWPQTHPGGSVGLRIDDDVAYVTDTIVMMENVAYVRGVSLLLHELWLNERDAAAQENENNRHACFGPVANFMKAASPSRMMPVHLYPHYDETELTDMVRKLGDLAGIPVEIPQEGRVYPV